jgi:cysteine desulfuration protein SufE
MSIEEREKEVIEEFEIFGEDWEGKYEHLIELGKSLPPIAGELKTENRLIKGCQSRVWLHTDLVNGKINYCADSDAIMTKGLIAMLIRVLNGNTPQEISAAQLSFLDKIGLKEHLSPTRANGLLNMIRQMKMDALALGMNSKIN